MPAAARFPLSAVPWILIIVGLLLAGYGIGQFAGAATPIKRPDSAKTTPDAAQLEKQFKDLDNYRNNLQDRLDLISRNGAAALWLLSAVLVVAGLLITAQSYFALNNAKEFERRSEDALDKIRTRFPLLADIDSAFTKAFETLSRLSPQLDLDQNLYKKADPQTRQWILANESVVALEFLAHTTRGEQQVQRLRLLGKFYAGKYSFDAKPENHPGMTAGEIPQPLMSDFERARYYFELASESQWGFKGLNDLSWLYSQVALPKGDANDDCAKQYCERSLRTQPEQQRALYNLGTIALVRNDQAKLERALRYMLDAQRKPNWEDKPNPAMAARVDYNLACVYDGLASFEVDVIAKAALLQHCRACLWRAALQGTPPREDLNKDLEKGDLANLNSDSASTDVLAAILAQYEVAWKKG
jgi:hypothetical protein